MTATLLAIAMIAGAFLFEGASRRLEELSRAQAFERRMKGEAWLDHRLALRKSHRKERSERALKGWKTRMGCVMGKRSSFERVPRDYYPTPREAVLPLLPHLPERTRYIEPCAGDGALVSALRDAGHHCLMASDIEPRAPFIEQADALTIEWTAAPLFITNPPWDRKVLHPLIRHLVRYAPTWLLFDADWIHTRQSAPFMHLLRKVVSVGRVKWIPDSPFTGKDNCAWHLFDANSEGPAILIGRAA